MKNLLKKVLSVAAATALLMTSVVSASAADVHSHAGAGTGKLYSGSDGYKIKLTAPESGSPETHIHYAAYQVFSGTPKKQTTDPLVNPGNQTAPDNMLPITDIKFGEAFGTVGTPEWQAGIVDFVYALGTVPVGDYAYAFSVMGDSFKGFINDAHVDGSDTQKLDEKFYYLDKPYNDANVNFDYLALEVARVISENNNRQWLQAFTDILGGFASNTGGDSYLNKGFLENGFYYQGNYSYGGEAGVSNTFPYEITVPAGYYMVVDLSSIDRDPTTENDEAYSARMLFVANNISQQIKSSVPKLTKNVIREDGTLKDTEVAGVGDTVKFKLTGTLPSNYDNYLGGYQYRFIDTLDAGLVFDPDAEVKITVTGILYDVASDKYVNVDDIKADFPDSVVTINTDSFEKTGGDTSHHHLVSDDDKAYVVSYDDDNHKMDIYFECLKEIVITDTKTSTKYTLGYNDGESSVINVEYSAIVTENATVGPDNGNENSAQIQYSNNPQAYSDTDYTTIEKSMVYSFAIDITKADAANFIKKNSGDTTITDDQLYLSGAQFALLKPTETDNEYQVAFVNADGDEISGWSTAFTAETPKEMRDEIAKIITSSGKVVNFTTNTNGKLNIKGLDAEVTYTLVETKTPNDGLYAYIDPFTVKLTADTEDDGEYNGKIESVEVDHELTTKTEASLEHYVVNDESTKNSDTDGKAPITVANFKYTDLPSTGGIGVYIYYIAGGCVVALALVLFALSKKKKTTK